MPAFNCHTADMNTNSPIFISDEQIAQSLDFQSVEASIARAFDSLARGSAQIMQRTRTDCGPYKLSNMGAIWSDATSTSGYAACKVYTTVNGQFNFLLCLFELASAKTWVMPAQALTAWRTPAISTWVARRAFEGHTPPRVLALFGAGVQARAHAECMQQAFGFDEIRVVDLHYSDQAIAWMQELSTQHQIRVKPATAVEALDQASLIVTATRSKTPVFDGKHLPPGAVICAVGTSLPNGSELDDTTLSKMQRVIVEYKPQSLVEAGEVVHSITEGLIKEQDILDLAQLHAQPLRTCAQQTLLFKTVGVGLTDLACAVLAKERLSA